MGFSVRSPICISFFFFKPRKGRMLLAIDSNPSAVAISLRSFFRIVDNDPLNSFDGALASLAP